MPRSTGPRSRTARTDRSAESSAARRAARVKLRRGLTNLGMTLVLPGSAQLATGHRALGRFAIRVWAVLWALVALLALIAVINRGWALNIVASAWGLGTLQVIMVLVAVGWGGLFVDAWRLSRPVDMAQRHRLGFAVLSAGLAFSLILGGTSAARIVAAQQDLLSSVFAGGGETEQQGGRYNILLMGVDADPTRPGVRPDSVSVASVDAETGRTVLIGLPRNLEDIPFPESSPMFSRFPQGYTCDNHECMLNSIYTYATANPDLYPGVADPGAQATKEAVESVTGLGINYYAMVDMKGFQALIDAVGGIRVDINKRVPVGGGSTKIRKWLEVGKNVELNGGEALWFARSRADSSDFERMARQKCVMNAMLNQLDPVTVLTQFTKISEAGKRIAFTDVPQDRTGVLMDLALKSREHKIASVSLVPPLVHPGSPDFAVIRTTIADKIAASEAADAADAEAARSGGPNAGRPAATGAAPAGGPSAAPTRTASAKATDQQYGDPQPPGSPSSPPASPAASSAPSADGTPPAETDDLDSVCRAR